ncbi:peptide deformylase [Nocardioides aurantiacus]|uniref:Peptide deformylase n=1 Tax=Nocardioides aurantiacus TaxID=86796 RepID=A0A3N2CT55_9ACTN|nr:peptide deformylase [Nocardioides aurantiacus]ROR90685.1 peptide deformylase [Nocardioides aurantiacus]
MRDTSDLPVAPTSAELPTGGTVRPITRWGTDVMHRRQRPVTAHDEDLARLVADMTATMYAADGVGLAACQIGVDLAVFVFDCPDEDGVIHRGVVCNPEVALPVGRDRRLDDGDEGCLSYPGAFVECPRPDWARVTGTGLDGTEVSYEGDGLLARCLQHETDHTLGTVFGDRVAAKARKRLRKQMEAEAADYPEGWPAVASPASDAD